MSRFVLAFFLFLAATAALILALVTRDQPVDYESGWTAYAPPSGADAGSFLSDSWLWICVALVFAVAGAGVMISARFKGRRFSRATAQEPTD